MTPNPQPDWPTPPQISAQLRPQIQAKIDAKTKPPGSLGRLETLALELALAQNTLCPDLSRGEVLVFAADHGAASSGISAFPSEVTGQMVANFLAGGAAINALAKVAGLDLRVVDAGVNAPLDPHERLVSCPIAPGTANYLEQPAMTAAQRDRALAQGLKIALDELHPATQILVLGEMGIGNSSSAALLAHCITGIPLEQAIGPGTGLDEDGLARKRRLLEQAIQRGGQPPAALDALLQYGGYEIAMMAGAMLGAASKRVVTLVDGYICGAAALVACALRPSVRPYLFFGHRSREPGHAHVLRHLQAQPILELSLALGEGTGAALAYPILRSSAAFLSEMASFEDAQVSGAHTR